MKPSALFAFFFFLLFAFTTPTPTTGEPLIDIDGDMVRNAGRYYLNPNSHVRGSGIIYAPIMHEDSTSCTLAVVDDPFNGGREIILTTFVRTAFLSTNAPINIAFADLPPNICTNDSNWVVTKSLPLGKPVMVGFSAGESYDAIVPGWFFIKSVGIVSERHHYKLVFCEVEKECKDIGVHVDNENSRRLVVTNKDPLAFTIRKEWRSFASDLSMVE